MLLRTETTNNFKTNNTMKNFIIIYILILFTFTVNYLKDISESLSQISFSSVRHSEELQRMNTNLESIDTTIQYSKLY